MKAFWVLVAIAAVIYALTTDQAQSILKSDAMGSAHDRATEIDQAGAPTAAQESNAAGQ